MSEIGSPGIMHDVVSTFECTPTTPRQSISSSPITPRQRTDNAFEASPWYITDPLHGLHVVQVDDAHSFARWKYKCDPTDSGWTLESVWGPLADKPWLRFSRSERTYRLVLEREAIMWCRYIVHICLYISPLAGTGPSRISEDIDLIIYICQNLNTKTVSVRFIAEGTRAPILQHRPMGFDLVMVRGVQTLKFTQWEPWFDSHNKVIRKLLGWRVVIADRHELQPFTWPSNDDDVERAQLFKSRFGHGAATNSLV